MIGQMLAAGDDEQLAIGVYVGLLGALFVALMWLRVWRWLFALFGLRA
jgi:hypothetical protein